MKARSIFENVKLTDPEAVERFIEALEASERGAKTKPTADPDEIRKFMSKRKTKK